MLSEIKSGASVVVERRVTRVLAAHRLAKASPDKVAPALSQAMKQELGSQCVHCLCNWHCRAQRSRRSGSAQTFQCKQMTWVNRRTMSSSGSWFAAGVTSAFCKSSADKRINLIEGFRGWVKSNSKLLLHQAQQASIERRISALQDQKDADDLDSNELRRGDTGRGKLSKKFSAEAVADSAAHIESNTFETIRVEVEGALTSKPPNINLAGGYAVSIVVTLEIDGIVDEQWTHVSAPTSMSFCISSTMSSRMGAQCALSTFVSQVHVQSFGDGFLLVVRDQSLENISDGFEHAA
ncbi:hypothetical protein KC326_g185 [Hortaea werneckii]|nr:hypothetical protein KC326_g185 [Hortaea werneckii]